MRCRRAGIRHCVPTALLAAFAAATVAGDQELKLPSKEGSVKFAVLGDWGTGAKEQYQVGEQMAAFHTRFPFTFVPVTLAFSAPLPISALPA